MLGFKRSQLPTVRRRFESLLECGIVTKINIRTERENVHFDGKLDNVTSLQFFDLRW